MGKIIDCEGNTHIIENGIETIYKTSDVLPLSSLNLALNPFRNTEVHLQIYNYKYLDVVFQKLKVPSKNKVIIEIFDTRIFTDFKSFNPRKVDFMESIKDLPPNVTFKYKGVNSENKIINKEVTSFDPWLLNLSADHFKYFVSKLEGEEAKRYALLENDKVKNFKRKIMALNPQFEDYSDIDKLNIVISDLNHNFKLMPYGGLDDLEALITKKGDRDQIKRLLVILTNNRYFKIPSIIKNNELYLGETKIDLLGFHGKQNILK